MRDSTVVVDVPFVISSLQFSLPPPLPIITIILNDNTTIIFILTRISSCASPRTGEGFAIIICNKALAPFLNAMRDGCANCPDCLSERKANPYLSALFGCKTLRSPVLYQAIMAGGGDPALQVFSAVVRHTDSCFSFLASKQ